MIQVIACDLLLFHTKPFCEPIMMQFIEAYKHHQASIFWQNQVLKNCNGKWSLCWLLINTIGAKAVIWTTLNTPEFLYVHWAHCDQLLIAIHVYDYQTRVIISQYNNYIHL